VRTEERAPVVFQIFLIVSTLVLLPTYLIVSLGRTRETSRGTWLLKVLSTGTFLLFMFVAGRWDWLSYYIRYLILLLFIAAAVTSYRRIAPQPLLGGMDRSWWWRNSGSLASLLLSAVLLGWALLGYAYAASPVLLAFPLEHGWYYVGQGGNTILVNYHNSSRAQRYAADITELNAWGARAQGVHPDVLERYNIFGRSVHSPCDGTISARVDGFPAHIPPAADRRNPAGNHVVIACKGVDVLLAHLQARSLLVAPGDVVSAGQPLGRVGNSGNTSEPHLHIHAVRAGSGGPLEGDGVPILFDGTFAVRNATF